VREIEGYEGVYAIDKDSTIYNVQTKRVKHPSIGNHGYHAIDLYKNGERTTFLVHRIMAATFLPNPTNKRTVNHKDGNKLNNNIDNLEWATYSENNKHSYSKLGRKAYMTGRFGRLNHNSKPVLMYAKNGNLLQKYDSIMDAERATGILNNAIVQCLKEKTKTAGGYKWRYAQWQE
jgi:hypothetical protein